jgi:hypothetical protein
MPVSNIGVISKEQISTSLIRFSELEEMLEISKTDPGMLDLLEQTKTYYLLKRPERVPETESVAVSYLTRVPGVIHTTGTNHSIVVIGFQSNQTNAIASIKDAYGVVQSQLYTMAGVTHTLSVPIGFNTQYKFEVDKGITSVLYWHER